MSRQAHSTAVRTWQRCRSIIGAVVALVVAEIQPARQVELAAAPLLLLLLLVGPPSGTCTCSHIADR